MWSKAVAFAVRWVCLHCAGQMRIIVFILDAPTVRKILDHIGEDARPRRITPARGPALCDEFNVALAARQDASADVHQQWDRSAQSAPEYQNGACLDLPTRRYVNWDGCISYP